MSYSMPNQSLVNGSLGFPGDPTSLMAAMGSQIGQMPYDVSEWKGKKIGARYFYGFENHLAKSNSMLPNKIYGK